MEIENIILDFDGTLTSVFEEVEPTFKVWEELLLKRTGIPRELYNVLFEEIKEEVRQNPKSGYNVGGYIVCSATSDPSVFISEVYRVLLERLRNKPGNYNIPPDQESTDTFLKKLYAGAYPFSKNVFRKNAKEFLDELTEKYSVAIVSNSRTDPVKKKLKLLGNYQISVIGNAKKDIIDNSLEEVPESVQPDGFPRRVLLRRPHYKQVLDNLKREGFHPENTVVIGDIYEFDLALPQHLGYRVILMETKGIQEYERQYIMSGPNNFVTKDLNEAMKFLNGIV